MGNDRIYYYSISEDTHELASWSGVWTTSGSIEAMERLLAKGDPPNTTGWTEITPVPPGLDFVLKGYDQALIIVNIANSNNKNQTYFEKGKPVQPVEIAGLRQMGRFDAPPRVIRASATYPKSSKQPLLASFRVNPKQTIDEVQGHHPKVGLDHKLGRLPFVFNFVDSADGVSPVLKEPHSHLKHGSDWDAKSHGGIHPPSASSMIMIAD